LHRDAAVLTSSSDPLLRARGARALLANENNGESLDRDHSANVGALMLSTMEDTHTEVTKSLYSDPKALITAVGSAALLEKMELLLGQGSRNMPTDVLSLHVNLLSVIPKEEEECDTCATLLFSHLLVTKAGFKRSAVVWAVLSQPNMVTKDAAFLRNCSKRLVDVDWKEIKGDQASMAKFNERIVDIMTSQYPCILRHALELHADI
jgi:hypothetical protein